MSAEAAGATLERWRRCSRHRWPTEAAHTCSAACAFWHDPRAPAVVCLATGAVHLCGRGRCRMPPVQGSDCAVCPLTGIVVDDQVCVHTRQFSKESGRPLDHMGPFSRIPHGRRGPPNRPQRKPFVLSEAIATRIAHNVLWGKGREGIRCIQMAREAKKISVAVRRILASGRATFMALQRVIASHRVNVPEIAATPAERQRVACLISAIVRYTRDHPDVLPANPVSVVCTWLTLLAQGVVCGGETAIAPDACIARLMPPPALMSLIDGVQCRSISAGTRLVKTHMIVGGSVVPSRRFSPYVRSQPRARRRPPGGPAGLSRAGATPVRGRVPGGAGS